MKQPLCIDLFCGLGGWTEGFLAEGYAVVGFDVERHVYGDQRYPAQLVLQDALTIHGSQFRDAAVIVASPPCQKYSWLAMPWSRSKDPNNSKAAKALRAEWEANGPDNRLFDACFRIQQEAIEATRRPCHICVGLLGRDRGCCPVCRGATYTQRYIPLIVENVRGAQPWVGRAAWSYGSFYLWGDVPALMPINLRRGLKRNPDGTNHPQGSWFAVADSKNRGSSVGGDGDRNRNIRHEDRGTVAELLASRPSGSQKGLGGGWFDKPYKERGDITGRFNSKSSARKAASAQIAKIPFELSSHIARCYYPVEATA